MARAALVLIAILSACGDGGDSMGTCVLDEIVADRTPAGAVDCGSFDLMAPDSDLQDAMGCMTSAVNTQEGFHVIWDRQGIDSQIRAAYYGTPTDNGYTVFQLTFDSDPSGGSGSGASSTEFLCTNLQPMQTCPDIRVSLCFQCTGPGGTAVCRGGEQI